MVTERRLGRGLGSLLGGSQPPAEDAARLEVPVGEIQPNPDQPRQHFDEAALEELRDSIRRHGVLQPVVLRRVADGYHLVAGERRWRAARLAGLSSLPAIIRDDVTDEQMLELALVENVQRADLDAIEKARGYQGMIEKLGRTQEQVAQMVGLNRATIANHVRLLDLPEQAQAAVSKGLISMGHARALLGAKDPERIVSLVERIVREGLSVRSTESAVRQGSASAPAPGTTTDAADTARPPWLVEMENRIRTQLGAKVRLVLRPGFKGQILIDYFGQDDLDRLANLLAPKREL